MISKTPWQKFVLRVPAMLVLFWCTHCIGKPAPSIANQAAPSAPGVPAAPSIDPGAPPEHASVELAIDVRHQTLEGFGASVAWYHDRIVGGSNKKLYQILFPELGLDILRLRNRFERSDSSDGNLAQDQEIFGRASEALGKPPRLMLSAWSPPAALKANGQEKCKGNADCTLKRVGGEFAYAAYADWWHQSLLHYQGLGLSPDFVSIQNEPSFIPPDWEGCKFEPRETADYPGYAEALEAVHAKLSALEPRPKILGPEVLGVHYERVQKYVAAMNLELVDGVAHHLYERGSDEIWDWRHPGPGSYVDEMRAVRASVNKPLFSTEFNTDEDQGVEGGFETAWLMHHSLVEEGVVAFLYWDLIWVDNKGLVSMKGRVPEPRDHYYSMRHFARYTDPGDVRVNVTSSHEKLLVSAYLAPSESRLTFVALNTATVPIDVDVAKIDFGTKSQVYQTVYRPGQSKRWLSLDASGSGFRLPARSVTTIVFEKPG